MLHPAAQTAILLPTATTTESTIQDDNDNHEDGTTIGSITAGRSDCQPDRDHQSKSSSSSLRLSCRWTHDEWNCGASFRTGDPTAKTTQKMSVGCLGNCQT
mmetsp:Transcript_18075/g.32778  ORF Transcript_18075/g.32778 Transcript_18075/m.32778 type:complete len:101 (-) Transcript_18075:628-930(-)